MITNVQGTCARKTPFPRLTDSSNIIDDGQPVKSHMDKDVFLFLPGLLPFDDVLEAHAAILEVLVNFGWMDTADPVEDAVCRRAHNPSHQLAAWEEPYSGKNDNAYKCCWRDLELDIVDYDCKYFDQRNELTIGMGGVGNIQARSCLEGIIQKHRDLKFRQRALVALAVLKAAVA